ncbi:hypothetical protein [Pseudomonas putida]|uniref:hypothetical protein n=1 Tax=Pseudomonas putida TaxID=303 RepID=UPI001C49AB6D
MTCAKQRPDIGLQGCSDVGFFRFGSGAEGRADKGQALEYDRHDVRLGRTAFEKGDLHQLTFHRQGVDIALQVATPDHD